MFVKQALSIGINAYVPSHLTLKPCLNDANDVSNSLHSIGFKAHCAFDVDLYKMKSLNRQFINSIQPGAVVVYYFSGHGVQYGGNNYLIPRDATGICADNIRSTAIDAQKLIQDMHAKRPRLVICILDCCRTVPPREPLDGKRRSKEALAGTTAGLAPMQVPPSTIIVYACAADDTASPRSRNGRNSLYTYHLLRYIKTPDIDIETLLRHVGADVQRESANDQIPYRYSSCHENICLVLSHGYKALGAPHYMHTKRIVQPLNRQHRKAIAVHHRQSQYNNVQYSLNDQFGFPIYHHAIVRNSTPYMKRIPLRHNFPFPKES